MCAASVANSIREAELCPLSCHEPSTGGLAVGATVMDVLSGVIAEGAMGVGLGLSFGLLIKVCSTCV